MWFAEIFPIATCIITKLQQSITGSAPEARFMEKYSVCCDFIHNINFLVARIAFFSIEDNTWRRTPPEHQRRNTALYELANEPISAIFIDPSVLLLEPSRDYYRVQNLGIPLYIDRDHLSSEGAKTAILPLLREHLVGIHKTD
jgi:hypothetical protein